MIHNYELTNVFEIIYETLATSVREDTVMFVSVNGGESVPHQYKEIRKFYKPLIMREIQNASIGLKVLYCEK